MNNESLIPVELFEHDWNDNKCRFAVELISWQLPSFLELLMTGSASIYVPNSCLDNMSLILILKLGLVP